MKKIQYILSCALIAAAGTLTQPATAQVKLADGSFPVIVAPHKQTVSFRERTLCYEITANVDFTATSNADWASVNKTDDGTVYIHLQRNPNPSQRTALVTFANTDKNLSETLVITQARNEAVEDLTADTQIAVASATANNNQSGYGVKLTYDGDASTFWHTNWSGTAFVVSETNPAVLTYTFNNSPHIDYINYVTRPDNGASGDSNGNFEKVKVYAQCGDATDYTLVGEYTFGGSNGTYRIDLGDAGLDNVKSIKFEITAGVGNNASCAEMQFMVDNRAGLFSLFSDQSYSALKDGTTQADIDNIDDEFVKELAQGIFNKTYDENYRVAEYTAKLNYEVQSDIWNAPGKYYDQRQGVTGINITKGTHAIAVSGLPEGGTVPMAVTAWYVGKVGGNFDGGNPTTTNYTLHNGLNTITYDGDYDGLAYICYYADVNPELQPTIKVHFINGQVNGYLDLNKTNEEMHELVGKAPNYCMDVVGNHAHSVWTVDGIDGKYSKGLYGACLSTDGTSLGYRQYIHVLDSLVVWEHNLLGFKKYDCDPDNRTMAYVNFTYYMFQGGFGVSFHVDQENRVLNCKTLVYNDNDAIWGLSHEWGHQHQMQPYFCWAGMGEVTNNMNSFYNIMRMGYTSSDKINNFIGAVKHFVTQDYSDITPNYAGTSGSRHSNMRHRAYEAADELKFSTDMYNLALAMEDSTITTASSNKNKALSINEVGVGETLAPFILLYSYFTTNGFPDFAPDWFEALRENDEENGSTVEKDDGVDKYELIASAQNNNKNSKYAVLKEKYPTSCWITENYVTESSTKWQNSMPYILNFIRKTSRLTGYNLIPFFEQWGFLRHVALNIGDYGNKWTVLTDKMYDEFVTDMNDLNLKTMDSAMVKAISDVLVISGNSARIPCMEQTRPTFPN